MSSVLLKKFELALSCTICITLCRGYARFVRYYSQLQLDGIGHWMERGFFLTFDGNLPPETSCEAIAFLSCFLFSNFTGVRRFFLLFTFLTYEILIFWWFSLHSRMLVFVSLLSRVCVWGGGRGGRRGTLSQW